MCILIFHVQSLFFLTLTLRKIDFYCHLIEEETKTWRSFDLKKE